MSPNGNIQTPKKYFRRKKFVRKKSFNLRLESSSSASLVPKLLIRRHLLKRCASAETLDQTTSFKKMRRRSNLFKSNKSQSSLYLENTPARLTQVSEFDSIDSNKNSAALETYEAILTRPMTNFFAIIALVRIMKSEAYINYLHSREVMRHNYYASPAQWLAWS